ncbi:MAG: tRNA (adenosine(37)-N6)-dimethylallyltransferase MiaA, partial [Hyphomonadaceae bacterium]|nr:tRNA (adenosine(37)-N6)-dimethylallyltransferase MiaA [Clostridia bacterium]
MDKTLGVIIGPTASGKTALSVALAKKLNGEIVSADSMQVYRHMDIGTAKPSLGEQQGIPHFLMDAIDPKEAFNVARYQQMAFSAIDNIIARENLPFLVGGTGLYINAVVDNVLFSETVMDEKYRQYLWDRAESIGTDA